MSIADNKRLSVPIYGAIRGAGIAAAACVAIGAATLAYAGSGIVPKTAVSLPAGSNPLASFDISWVDTVSGNYFLSDRSNTALDMINTTTLAVSQVGKGVFAGLNTTACGNGCSGPNGVLTIGGQLVLAGDANSTLRVFPIPGSGSTAVASSFYTGFVVGDPNRLDEGCYDPVDNIVVFANDNDGPGGGNGSNVSPQNGGVAGPYITFFTINPTTGAVVPVGQIIMDGGNGLFVNPISGAIVGHGPNATNGIEQCQYNPRDGKFWINLPEVNGPGNDTKPGNTLVIDPSAILGGQIGGEDNGGFSSAILAIYTDPIAQCVGPQGMAIGPQPQILLGCNGNKNGGAASSTIILNDGTTGGVQGSVFAVLPNQVGSDEVDYNPSSRVYTLAESSNFKVPTTLPATPTITPQVGIVNAISLVQDVSIATGAGGNAHSVASDPSSRKTFLPVGNASAAGKLCSSNGGVDANGCILVLVRQVSNTHDFNADTTSDVLWRDTSGNVGQWSMQAANCANTQVSSSAAAAVQSANVFGQVPLTWSIVGQRDFVGTGSSSILWRDNVGDVAIWLMSVGANGGGTNTCGGLTAGGQISSVISLGPVPTNLSVVGTGEFNANGMGDILFQDANTGNLTVILMSGSTQLGSRSIGKVPTGYTVVGVDRKGWIFLNNPTTNDVTIETVTCPPTSLTCTTTSTDIGTAPAQWKLKAIGDLDGNGVTDILWIDSSNNVGAWFMTEKADVPTFVTSTVYGAVPAQWSIAQTGDMNGDGTADILWIDTSGNVGAWYMQGKTISAVSAFGNVGTTWSVQSLSSQ